MLSYMKVQTIQKISCNFREKILNIKKKNHQLFRWLSKCVVTDHKKAKHRSGLDTGVHAGFKCIPTCVEKLMLRVAAHLSSTNISIFPYCIPIHS